jgi:hypothetical protein
MNYLVIGSAAAVLTALIIYKRCFFRAKTNRSVKRSFWLAFSLYFVPATIALCWLIHSALRSTALPDPWRSIGVALALYSIATLLLKDDLTALRRASQGTSFRLRL